MESQGGILNPGVTSFKLNFRKLPWGLLRAFKEVRVYSLRTYRTGSKLQAGYCGFRKGCDLLNAVQQQQLILK